MIDSRVCVQPCGLKYVTFMLHSANWNLTQSVLTTLSAESAFVVLVDASLGEETRTHAAWLAHIRVPVVYSHLPLTVSQGLEVHYKQVYAL